MDFAEQQLLFLQRRLDAVLPLLALGNVEDGRQHHRPLVGLDRIEADLDREFAAVLAQTEEVAAGVHRSRARIAEKCAAPRRIAVAEPLRRQHFDGLAEQLGARITEHALRLRIDHFDAAGRIDHHHRIGRRLDD
jgi:hypothetical protein